MVLTTTFKDTSV